MNSIWDWHVSAFGGYYNAIPVLAIDPRSRTRTRQTDPRQMLVVENRVKEESAIPHPTGHQDEYIWPHGITPPMRHVRKRRFRQRLSRRAIEVVEEQVEELLKRDSEADAPPEIGTF